MLSSFSARSPVILSSLIVVALTVGLLAATAPFMAIGVVVLAMIVWMIVAAPVATLVAIIVLTAMVPYGLMNRYGVGGGSSAAGLLASDVVLLFALARAAVVLRTRSLSRQHLLMSSVLLVFLAVTALQLVHGASTGRDLSAAGSEFRTLLGFSVFLVALPLVGDPKQFRRLAGGLLGVMLALGTWGLIQWFTQLGFVYDVGVREGVALTTSGRGQLQGGLFAYPIAVVGAYAALLSGLVASSRVRLLLWAALGLNAVCLLLTYERTFWVATVLGLGFVTIKATGSSRIKAMIAAPLVVLVGIGILSAVAPNELRTAQERVLTLRDTSSDESLQERFVESEYVLDEIRAQPLGSGLGATIFFGDPANFVPPTERVYSHNAYLWLAWKVGIPAGILLTLLFVYAVVARSRTTTVQHKALATGAQGGLLALLLINPNFPAFNGLSITATMGLLLALATLPKEASEDHPGSPSGLRGLEPWRG